MLRIKKLGVILRPTRLAFESKCVFNPGIYQDGNTVHMIYRALDDNYVSTLGYARFEGPTKLVERFSKPLYTPKFKYESHGMEDPCIVKIDDTIYMTYVAHDGVNALIAYMYGDDILNLKRGGIISPLISYHKAAKLFDETQLKDDYYMFGAYYEKYGDKNIYVWEKDGVLFPEMINKRYALLHRILPDVQLIKFDDFKQLKNTKYWEEHIRHLADHVVLEGDFNFQNRHIGAGAPPIKTKDGWILINHAVQKKNSGRIYRATAALLDLNNPQKVIARLPYPLFSPEEDYELEGHVNNVVFPTGISIFNNQAYIYYGTSDSYVAVTSVDIDELREELLKNKV
ncbi:pesticidal protein Cry7Aa [Candidatus Parcubacteria bacterium]|nr:MAG: pesticidal protein Cry7Aa [Candidatus Parcubacteria bacterium]